MTITEDDTGSLILKIHGGLEILSEEDEAALLARLLERAGGVQNLLIEELVQAEARDREIANGLRFDLGPSC